MPDWDFKFVETDSVAAGDQEIADAVTLLRKYGQRGFVIHIRVGDGLKTRTFLPNGDDPSILLAWAQGIYDYSIRLADGASQIMAKRLMDLLLGSEPEDEEDENQT